MAHLISPSMLPEHVVGFLCCIGDSSLLIGVHSLAANDDTRKRKHKEQFLWEGVSIYCEDPRKLQYHLIAYF